jgi:UDP-glucose 4-epimerase
MSSTALVTGCAGFIGSHVADHLLERGHQVIGIDDLSRGARATVPDGVDFREGSTQDPSTVEALFDAHAIDFVFHLTQDLQARTSAGDGANAFVGSFNALNDHALGGTHLVQAAAGHPATQAFVYASTTAVYAPSVARPSEQQAPDPSSERGIASHAMEQRLRQAREADGLNTIIFRLHDVYGPRLNVSAPADNIVARLVRRVLDGAPIPVPQDRYVRAFTHIDDVAPILARSVERDDTYNKVFNLGNEEEHAVVDVARILAQALDVRPVMERTSFDGPRRHVPAHARLEAYFGDLRRHVSLEDGLGRFADWLRERSSVTVPESLSRNASSPAPDAASGDGIAKAAGRAPRPEDASIASPPSANEGVSVDGKDAASHDASVPSASASSSDAKTGDPEDGGGAIDGNDDLSESGESVLDSLGYRS